MFEHMHHFKNLVKFSPLSLILAFSLSTIQAQKNTNKVVMISLDGVPDYIVDDYLARRILPQNGAFAKMKTQGAYANQLIPINVASTGPSHISVFTGAPPSVTGIVGNSFRQKSQAWEQVPKTAFTANFSTETIFQAAIQQGKKVVAFGGVGLDAQEENRRVSKTFVYPTIAGPSLIIDLEVTKNLVKSTEGRLCRRLQVGATSPSKSMYEVNKLFSLPLFIYVSDSIVGETNILSHLTQLIVDTDNDINNGYNAVVTKSNWTEMLITKNGNTVASSLKIIQSNEVEGKYRLFITAPAALKTEPNSFLDSIQLACGIWPGEPENLKQSAGLIPEEIWFEQVERLANYTKKMIIAGMKMGEWDLLFGYFSLLDDVQHRYTLTDKRQIDYEAEGGQRRQRYKGYLEKYFSIMDAHLLEIMRAAPEGTNFVVFSDHGMIPIHSTLLLNNYLEYSGFGVSNQLVTSVTSGNSAHIYLNNNKINATEKINMVNSIRSQLAKLRDSISGEKIFELVADKEAQENRGLYHEEHAGDLFVSCKPGYSISSRFIPTMNYLVNNSFDQSIFQNQRQVIKDFLVSGTMNETGRAVHGSLGKIRKGQSIFYAMGPQVPRKKIEYMESLQIAPTVAYLLGINPPSGATKQSVL